HDSMQIVEHSVEALIPFLQYQNRDVEIISILVPYCDLQTMDKLSSDLATAIAAELKSKNLNWGNDVALLITSDAVHYGDEEWGIRYCAPHGTDSIGYKQALNHENEIINHCFTGLLTQDKADKFFRYTVSENDYKEYIWTWCGRYSIPVGMKTAEKLAVLLNEKPLTGIKIGYSTSIGQKHIPVQDLRMGTTAIATQRHWVGYPAIGFR
ncbi:MAG: AmmeMemoRadiSam system protein B, partial [Prolixibacteraceae bacterium]|nr:AmmeMemoRadiSam system protein B [Prolixibacteraceae bacterium]